MSASTRQPQYNYATSSWFTNGGPITCALLLLGMVDRLRSSASSELGPLLHLNSTLHRWHSPYFCWWLSPDSSKWDLFMQSLFILPCSKCQRHTWPLDQNLWTRMHSLSRSTTLKDLFGNVELIWIRRQRRRGHTSSCTQGTLQPWDMHNCVNFRRCRKR